jgi:DNA-binding transcriptional regulator of glucitol operon
MKKLLIPVLLLVSTLGWSQSKSYQTLQHHFDNRPDVQAFSLGGWLCRAALSLAMDDDDRELNLLKKAMADINHVRFIVIPKHEFRQQGLSVNGFRSYLKKDSFELLADVRDQGEQVTFYHRSDGTRKDRYFVLVDDQDEVVAIEMKGYIDPAIFESEDARITLYNK